MKTKLTPQMRLAQYSLFSVVVALAVLKVCGLLEWSWWAILSPYIVILSVCVPSLVVLFFLAMWHKHRGKRTTA